ncbi:MAG: hypothetical protein V4596_08635 [Bdellovibrionota bacterium]
MLKLFIFVSLMSSVFTYHNVANAASYCATLFRLDSNSVTYQIEKERTNQVQIARNAISFVSMEPLNKLAKRLGIDEFSQQKALDSGKIVYVMEVSSEKELRPFLKTIQQMQRNGEIEHSSYGLRKVEEGIPAESLSFFTGLITIRFNEPLNSKQITSIANNLGISLVKVKQNKNKLIKPQYIFEVADSNFKSTGQSLDILNIINEMPNVEAAFPDFHSKFTRQHR